MPVGLCGSVRNTILVLGVTAAASASTSVCQSASGTVTATARDIVAMIGWASNVGVCITISSPGAT